MERLAYWLSSLVRSVDRTIGVLAGLLMAGILCIVLLAVFFRYVLNASLYWAEEAARYLSVWMLFLSVGIAYRLGEHVRVTAFLDWLPYRTRQRLQVAANVTELGLALILTWYGWVLAVNNLRRGQLSPALQIPIGWIYMAIPVGLGLASLYILEDLLTNLVTLRRGQPAGRGLPMHEPTSRA